MKTKNSDTPSGSASLEKALALFKRILKDHGNTKLPDLAAGLALPRSTLYRLAKVLEQAGLIVRLEKSRYDVGLQLIEKLSGISVASQMARICRSELQRLANTCGVTTHLGVLENDMVTYLVKAIDKTADTSTLFTRENAQLEAYCSAIGKVLLAWLPEFEQTRYLSGGPFVALTERTITDPDLLYDCLKAVRADQFATDDGEVEDNLYCLAVPLWTTKQPMTAAISISFSRRKRPETNAFYLNSLRACAKTLSFKLNNA